MGKCLDFAKPVENGCDEHFEPYGEDQCAKLEMYPTNFEDAVQTCRDQGGDLLAITNQDIQV